MSAPPDIRQDGEPTALHQDTVESRIALTRTGKLSECPTHTWDSTDDL